MKGSLKNKLKVGIPIVILLLSIFFLVPNLKGSHYGQISNSLESSYEWNKLRGAESDMVRVGTSEYYLHAYVDNNYDGCVNTTQVFDDNGTVRQRTLDYLRFDSVVASNLNIVHIANEYYAIGYASKIRTIRVFDTNGTICPNVDAAYIDTVSKRFGDSCGYNDLAKVGSNMFIDVHSNLSLSGGWVESVFIRNNGDIASAYNDTVRYNATGSSFVRVKPIDGDTFVIIYGGNYTAPNKAVGYIATYNVSATTGDITNTPASTYRFTTGQGSNPDILHVNGNIYLIAYCVDSGMLEVSTVSITTEGKITQSLTSTSDTYAGSYPTLFTVNNGSTYGVTYQSGTTFRGNVTTFNVSSTGTVGNPIDLLMFETTITQTYSPIAYVNKSWYYISWAGVSNDGWSGTAKINTNWATPTLTPSPANGTIGVAGPAPVCSLNISDDDEGGDTTILWMTNESGSWQHAQLNSTCYNGSFKWIFSDADTNNTRYWWRVYVNDGIHNVSATYYFTLETTPLVETTILVHHNLSRTPNFIVLTPTSYPDTYVDYYTDSYNNTCFTIHLIAPEGIIVSFMWKAEII